MPDDPAAPLSYFRHGIPVPTRRTVNLLRCDLWAHVFYDSSRFAEQERGFYSYIDRLESELKGFASKRIQKKYRDFFFFSDGTSKKKALTVSRNEGAIAQALRTAGFIVFITNNERLVPEDILKLYRRRDDIEKAFDDLKNGVDFKRFKTHTQATTDGKAFVGFIALILRSYMRNLLHQREETKGITMRKALLELGKLRHIITENGTEWFLPPTKTQTTLSKALGLIV